MKTYKAIAQTFIAWKNCIKSGNTEWEQRHEEKIKTLVKDLFPSGSGFDAGTEFDFKESRSDKLVFTSAFHLLNSNGYYDGWIPFKVIVRGSLASDFYITVRGQFSKLKSEYSGHKDYIAETFQNCLDMELILEK